MSLLDAKNCVDNYKCDKSLYEEKDQSGKEKITKCSCELVFFKLLYCFRFSNLLQFGRQMHL